ncbi:MAG: cell envelope integrity protein TolA [Gammaproteobacteria bacterium]|nr:MAG: cell envelope integrity protein TolA [Gammaproteobacteria bacterium]
MRISKDLKKFGIYSLAGLFSLVLHAFVVLLLLVGWTEKNTVHKPKRPNFVQATLVQMAPRAKAQERQVANKKAKAAAKKRAEKQRKEKARKKKAAERKKAERKKAEQKKARDEKNRRDKAWKKKQADEKARKADAQKKKAEREKKAKAAEQLEELQRQARAQALASALDNEDEFLADEQSEQVAQGYQSYIQQRIIANWNRPLSARRGMETILSIQLVPTGQVVGVSVIKSSGNDAFDLSAQQAVKKVGRFEKLQQLSRESPVIFEQNFRQFQLVFRPEDLRL